jgi:hypothetical protein
LPIEGSRNDSCNTASICGVFRSASAAALIWCRARSAPSSAPGHRLSLGARLDLGDRAQGKGSRDEAAQAGLGRPDRLVGEVQLRAVVRTEQEEAVGHRMDAGVYQVGQPGAAPADFAIF